MARLEVKWLPAVGAARYEVREQGLGDTALERYESGIPLGPRVDSTRFVFTAAESRPYNLSIRSYNRTGVASREPKEITVTPGGAEGARVPSDIDLVMYLSMDEKFDQNGDLMEPQIFPDGTIPIMPGGSVEQRRRLRYDQGISENHMVVGTDISSPITIGGRTVVHATSEKQSPSNRHIQMGDADDGTAAGRATLGHSEIHLIVDPRTGGAIGGQTDADFLDNFTLVGWINPVLIWQKGWTADDAAGHRIILWSRHGAYDVDPSGVGTRGWALYLGGPPWFASNIDNGDIHRNDGVNGFCFIYLQEGTYSSRYGGSGSDEELLDNGNAAFWPYEYERGLDNLDNPPVDEGKYCGWLFFAMTCSLVSDGEVALEMWVGRADQDDLKSLNVIVKPQLRLSMWTPPNEDAGGPRTMATCMIAINHLFNDARIDLSGIENNSSIADFAKFDEMRIYRRQLVPAEIRGLYNHPGGQKRTENLIEIERQVV